MKSPSLEIFRELSGQPAAGNRGGKGRSDSSQSHTYPAASLPLAPTRPGRARASNTRSQANSDVRAATRPRAGGAGAAGRAEVRRARRQHGGRALVAAVRALAACGHRARPGAHAAPTLVPCHHCPGPAGVRAAASCRLQLRPALAPAQPRRSTRGRLTGRRRRGRRRRQRRRRDGQRRGRAGHYGLDAAARPRAFPQRPAHRRDEEPRLSAVHQNHRGELPPSPRLPSGWELAAAARCSGLASCTGSVAASGGGPGVLSLPGRAGVTG